MKFNFILIVTLSLCIHFACMPMQSRKLPPERLRNIACRIVAISWESAKTLKPLLDGNVDTLSSNPADQTVEAVIHDGRRLAVQVRHVNIRLPRDRFNVTMTLDGKVFLRTSHMDLDIYLETTIDDRVYALHCFPEFAEVDERPRTAVPNQ